MNQRRYALVGAGHLDGHVDPAASVKLADAQPQGRVAGGVKHLGSPQAGGQLKVGVGWVVDQAIKADNNSYKRA